MLATVLPDASERRGFAGGPSWRRYQGPEGSCQIWRRKSPPSISVEITEPLALKVPASWEAGSLFLVRLTLPSLCGWARGIFTPAYAQAGPELIPHPPNPPTPTAARHQPWLPRPLWPSSPQSLRHYWVVCSSLPRSPLCESSPRRARPVLRPPPGCMGSLPPRRMSTGSASPMMSKSFGTRSSSSGMRLSELPSSGAGIFNCSRVQDHGDAAYRVLSASALQLRDHRLRQPHQRLGDRMVRAIPSAVVFKR